MGNWGQRPPQWGQQAGYGPQPGQPYQYQQQFAQQQQYRAQPGYPQPQQAYAQRYPAQAQWAAPGQMRPLPSRKPSSGLGVVAILVLVFVGLPVLFVVIGVGVALALAVSQSGASTTTTEQEQPITLPDTHALTPITTKGTATEEAAWESGYCGDFSKERDHDDYVATRNEGSAKVLRGKVAIVNIHLTSPSLKWTKLADSDATQAAQLAQRFLAAEAARYKVTDLRLDVIPWSLNTALDLPGLATGSNDLLTVDTMRFIRDSSRLAVETALGAHLESVVADLRRDGYAQVGFIIYLPVTTQARDFAFMAYNTQPPDDPELGFIFTPIGRNLTTEFGHLSVTTAHEALHLFGADDLYRIRRLDKTDAHDVMGEYCTGFKQATLLDATAYSVGWTSTAPKRPYRFVDR
ncbi:MAG: hypothetical protein ABI551_22940 [Polyangiaceae bacterium]